jgi:hypothetical protein
MFSGRATEDPVLEFPKPVDGESLAEEDVNSS